MVIANMLPVCMRACVRVCVRECVCVCVNVCVCLCVSVRGFRERQILTAWFCGTNTVNIGARSVT